MFTKAEISYLGGLIMRRICANLRRKRGQIKEEDISY